MKLFLTFILFCTCHAAENILSFQRSGVNLTLSLLQAATKKPVRWSHDPNSEEDINTNRLGLKIDYSKSTLYRTHEHYRLVCDGNDKLILLLRNYKECIPRQTKFSDEMLLKEFREPGKFFKLYMGNLKKFDRWPKEKRHLIYYEDLIRDPAHVIHRLAQFLGEKVEEGVDFNALRLKIVGSYNKQYKEAEGVGSASMGKSADHHSRSFSPKTLKEIDAHLKKKQPRLWKRYLYVYEN